jgi:hypothetical protein
LKSYESLLGLIDIGSCVIDLALVETMPEAQNGRAFCHDVQKGGGGGGGGSSNDLVDFS